MTVIISVKINDGVVMASDSASTFGIGQTYLHADKIVNLVKGLPIGAMLTGTGGIGSESVSTLLKDIRAELTAGTPEHDPVCPPFASATYTLGEVAQRVRAFLLTKVLAQDAEIWLKLRLCGYSAGRPLPEIWEVFIQGRDAPAAELVQGEESCGPLWDGEYEPLNRLILGQSDGLAPALDQLGLTDRATELGTALRQHNKSLFYLNAMPIQDAIDLARWLVETTSGFVRFNVHKQPKVVGGSTEIAAITKHEGFRWVQRRHFFPATLNPAHSAD